MIEQFCDFLRKDKYEFDNKIVILDIGSRDCIQSIEFTKYFPNSTVYAFECNPNTLELCKKNIEHYKNIKLIEGAINEYDGKCKFYPINKDKTITTWKDGNPGASSLFLATGDYPHETYIQDEIVVNCHRIDTILKKDNTVRVNLIWMDLQGAELLALKSMGNILNNVDYIFTEVSHKPLYHGQVLFTELHDFLCKNNFTCMTNVNISGWQEDVIYKNNIL
jgi:FkbM family methyltransferase